LRSHQLCSYSRTSTGSYPEPDESSPYHPHPTSLRPILLLPSDLRFGPPSGLFPSDFHINILCAFGFAPLVLYAPPILSSLTWSFYLYLAKSTSYEAPHYEVFFSLPSLHLSTVQIFCSAPSCVYLIIYIICSWHRANACRGDRFICHQVSFPKLLERLHRKLVLENIF
jgi:hypothetical protein